MKHEHRFTDEIHGTTPGKCYSFIGERCEECLAEAAERQARGFACELPRRAVIEELVLGPLVRPANSYPDYAFNDAWENRWHLFGTVRVAPGQAGS